MPESSPRKYEKKAQLEAIESGVQDWRGEDGRHHFLTNLSGAPNPEVGMVGILKWLENSRITPPRKVWTFTPLPPGTSQNFHFPHKVKARLSRTRKVIPDASDTLKIEVYLGRKLLDTDTEFIQTWEVISGPMKGTRMVMLSLCNGLPGAKVGDEEFLILKPDPHSSRGKNWFVKRASEPQT